MDLELEQIHKILSTAKELNDSVPLEAVNPFVARRFNSVLDCFGAIEYMHQN